MNWTRNAPQYWRPDIGPWMPVHKRVAPPRRWIRYVILTIFLVSGTWFGWRLLSPAQHPDGRTVTTMAERRPPPATMAPFVLQRGNGDER